MSHLVYYNNLVSVNEVFFNSHKSLIERVCKELGQDSAAEELVGKLLDKPEWKAKKDPNKPKRPKSAFLLYCDDERPKLIEKEKKTLKSGEKFNLGAVQKKLGVNWKKLSAEKKQKYEEAHEQSKEQYFDQLTEYETQLE